MNIELEHSAQELHKDIDDNRFEITLSVSHREVLTKEDGKSVINYATKSLTSNDKCALTHILTSQNYSTNIWNGRCAVETYLGMTGAVLDYDGTLTIEQARTRYAKWNHIIHTTTSHQWKEPKADRIRVILPYKPGDLRFRSQDEHEKVYWKLFQNNPEADTKCGSADRKFFPHCKESKSAFEMYVNCTGEYFDIDISGVPDSALKTKRPEFVPSEELGTKDDLARVMKFCPFIQWCQREAGNGLPEPLWYAMISNLCRFEGGRELIHDISAKDPVRGRYDFDETEDKIQQALESSGPIGYGTIVSWGWKDYAPNRPYSPAGWAKAGKSYKGDVLRIMWEDTLIVKVDENWTATCLADLKNDLLPSKRKLPAVCPKCDHDAGVAKTDEFGFAYVWCDKCQKACYESPITPDMYVYKNKVLRVERRNSIVSAEALDESSFRTELDYKYAKRKLLTNVDRKFLEANFQLLRIGDANLAEPGYEVNMQGNSMTFKFPALPVQVQDNAFIDAFLDRTFESYSGFIKDWMAMYSYTNHVMLPVIVLTGERSCGKGTFANMVGSIFPSLMGLWEGTPQRFNEYYKNKLLFVDENANADKPMQYVEIKKITGNKILRIDEKFIPPYNTLNNLKIIITTNDAKPIFLKAKEEPKSENTNNFFIYRVPNVDSNDINENLGQMLEERLGHYVRTELRARFERLMADRGKNNRYGIPAPITPLARTLFASAVTTIEIEAEELARYLVFGVNTPNPRNANAPNIYFKAREHNGVQFVQFQDIRELVKNLGFTGSPASPKSYVTVLQEQGVLSYDVDHSSRQYYGYAILRSKDYYTTTVSGMLPTCDDIDDESVSLKSDFHHSPTPSIFRALDTENDRNDENDTTF